MSSPDTIANGSRVAIHVSLSLEDGTEVMSTFDEEPMRFVLGDGTLEPTLESRLVGMKPGEEQALVLFGSDVYGPREDDKRQWIEADAFPPSLELAEGQVIAFNTPEGDEVAGIVEILEASRVLIDFNHPLSGRTIVFKTAVLEVENPE